MHKVSVTGYVSVYSYHKSIISIQPCKKHITIFHDIILGEALAKIAIIGKKVTLHGFSIDKNTLQLTSITQNSEIKYAA